MMRHDTLLKGLTSKLCRRKYAERGYKDLVMVAIVFNSSVNCQDKQTLKLKTFLVCRWAQTCALQNSLSKCQALDVSFCHNPQSNKKRRKENLMAFPSSVAVSAGGLAADVKCNRPVDPDISRRKVNVELVQHEWQLQLQLCLCEGGASSAKTVHRSSKIYRSSCDAHSTPQTDEKMRDIFHTQTIYSRAYRANKFKLFAAHREAHLIAVQVITLLCTKQRRWCGNWLQW